MGEINTHTHAHSHTHTHTQKQTQCVLLLKYDVWANRRVDRKVEVIMVYLPVNPFSVCTQKQRKTLVQAQELHFNSSPVIISSGNVQNVCAYLCVKNVFHGSWFTSV